MQDGPRTGDALSGIGERAGSLVRSACSSDLSLARALLRADPALDHRDLACACVTGTVDAVAQRIERDPELARTPVPPLHWEPILYACFSRFLRADSERALGIRAVVRLLLDAGADPNASFDHDGWLQVPLYGAAGIANDVAITEMLIEAGADPNDEGERTVGEALYHACEFPDPTCAAMLIDAGTKPSVVEYCLGRALNFPNEPMAAMFCSRVTQPRPGQLHQAAWRRRPVATVRALLDAGAPIDAPDEEGLTALQIATRWGEDRVAACLVHRGADTSVVTDADRALGAYLSGAAGSFTGTAALDEMLNLAVQGGHLDTARRLLDAGALVDGDPDSADAPLGQACWRGRVEIVAELLSRGAKLELQGRGTALGAALHGSRHCHDPEGGPTMRTADEVPREPYAHIVRILLDAGAEIPERLWDGAPPPPAMIAALGVDRPS
ncbi:MAG TPA: ankyrin repeat domain-containing protein [Solirubrobacteraceae bacterium]|nr:ankyrin repeat domain-containing protein [Solirubrobacteraceae bacterium]